VPGQEVDAFIMPVAPHAAVMPGRYLYTGLPTDSCASFLEDSLIFELLNAALVVNLY
jgi:hypothetical protein